MSAFSTLKIGIVTISDRASHGIYPDLSGKAIIHFLNKSIRSPFEPVSLVIPDDKIKIKSVLKKLVDQKDCALVLTTGGTGPAVRDVTPEATESICKKILPGFGEIMRIQSFKMVPTAILSRQIAGIRKKTLIINLPGKPAAIAQCLKLIFPAIMDGLKVIRGLDIKVSQQLKTTCFLRH